MGIHYTALSTFTYAWKFQKYLFDMQTYLIQNTWGPEAWEYEFLTS